jgi:hypothetical protein
MATVPWGPYGACRRDFADEEGELQTAGLKGVRSLASNGTQAKEERDVGIGRRAPGSRWPFLERQVWDLEHQPNRLVRLSGAPVQMFYSCWRDMF